MQRLSSPIAALAVGALLSGCASVADQAPRVGSIASQGLTRFSSEAEFKDYLAAVRKARMVGGATGAADGRVRYAQAATAGEAEPCLDIDCPGVGEEQIVVTGSRIPAAPSITNNQTAGVDEGDIVKLIGDHIIVLQDGRLFSIGVGDAKGGLKLADRANVYVNADDDAWYDELLVSDDRILVTGYSYDRNASEFTIFRLGDDGALTFEDKFFIESDDYYDDDNYATRIVDGKLIFYTPIDLYWSARRGDEVKWPKISHFDRRAEKADAAAPGLPLLAATEVYRPVQATFWPVIHALTACDIKGRRVGDALRCRTTGIIGPWDREFYVSPDDAYLWLESDDYDAERLVNAAGGCNALSMSERRTLGNALFRLPLGRGAANFVRVEGAPNDQFAMDASRSEFRALLGKRLAPTCSDKDTTSSSSADAGVHFLSFPLAAFGARGRMIADDRYIKTPDSDDSIENRFTSAFLVYGGRNGWGSYPPDAKDGPQTSTLVAISLRNPKTPAVIASPHNIIRLERIGENVIATGYQNDKGLSLSAIDLGGTPRIASTLTLASRYESEGRSHAFNSLIGEAGDGLLGLPTVTRDIEAGRWHWRSENSDVSFLAIDKSAALSDLGPLRATEILPEDEDAQDADEEDADRPFAPAGYKCEVSCVDWYGNSRPIFIGDRIFALAGFEFIEGEVANGAIREIGRIDITK